MKLQNRERGDIVQVGDLLLTTTAFGSSSFRITRTTKTLCFSKREEDGYEYKWSRVVSGDMSKPYQKWSTASYEVFIGEINA